MHSPMCTCTTMYLQVASTQTMIVTGPHDSNTFLASPPVITCSANAGITVVSPVNTPTCLAVAVPSDQVSLAFLG